jgi:hypothetical protein
VKALPNGEAWLAGVENVDGKIRHLSLTAVIPSTFQTAMTRSSTYPPPSGPAVTMWSGS